MTRGQSRSRLLLLSTAVGAVLLGGGLGYLMRPEPKSIGPQSVQIEVLNPQAKSDLRSALAAKFEALIDESPSGTSDKRTAILRNLALAVRRDEATAKWLAARLQRPDLPEELMLELLSEIGSEPTGQRLVRDVVKSRLSGESPGLQQQGLLLVRELRLGSITTSGSCFCQGGLFPAQGGSEEQRFFVAWPLKKSSGIRWDPQLKSDAQYDWSLHLESRPDDSLGMGLVHPVERGRIISSFELQPGGPRIALQSVD